MRQKDLKVKQKQSGIKRKEQKRTGQKYVSSPLKERMKADYIRTKIRQSAEKATSEAADSAVEQYEDAAISAGLCGLDTMQKGIVKAKAYTDFKHEADRRSEAVSDQPSGMEQKTASEQLSGMEQKITFDSISGTERNEVVKDFMRREMLADRPLHTERNESFPHPFSPADMQHTEDTIPVQTEMPIEIKKEILMGNAQRNEKEVSPSASGFHVSESIVQNERFPVPISERKANVVYSLPMEESNNSREQQKKDFVKSVTEKRFRQHREKRKAAKGTPSPEMTKSERDLHTVEKTSRAQQISYRDGRTAEAQHRFPERAERRFSLSGNRKSFSAVEKKAAGYKNNQQRKLLKKRFLSETSTVKTTARPTSAGERISRAVQRTAVAFVKGILAALGGLSGIIVIFVIVGAVLALVSTAFGVFFSPFDDTEGTRQIAEIVAETNGDFYAEVSEIETNVAHDEVQYHVVPDGGDTLFITNWTEVVAIFAAKLSGDPSNALDVITMDEERAELLKEVFWDMNELSYETETIGEEETETILHITLTSRNYSDMFDIYDFTSYQREAAEELLKPEYAQMLSELIGTIGISGGSISLSEEQIQEMLENLPEELSADRKAVMKAAYSLVGKVNYFWGGKSEVIGWDSRWGTLKKVTSAGSTTTGSVLPFGLDCSGFVTWVFINATGNTNYAAIIGHGAANQYGRCEKISWSEAQAGDLVFYPDLGHVGIIAGKDENGELLVVHCASSQNNVVVTGVWGFTKIGRPVLYME